MRRWLWLILVVLGACAARAAAQNDPVLGMIEQQNAASQRKIEAVTSQLEAARARALALEAQLKETEREFEADRQRVRISGSLGGPVSAVLLRHKSEMASAQEAQRDVLHAQQASAEAELKRMELADEIADLRNTAAAAERALRGAGGMSSASTAEVALALEVRLNSFLLPLKAVEDDLSGALEVVERREVARRDMLMEYRRFVDAQVVWLPNDSAVNGGEFKRAVDELGTLVSAGYWQDVLQGARASVREFPIRWLCYAGIIVVLFAYRRKFLRRSEALAEQVGTTSDRFLTTIRALFLAVLRALPVPVSMYLFSALLQMSPGGSDNAMSFALALDGVSDVVLLCTFLLEVSRPLGLGVVHFKWPESTTGSLRWGIRVVENLAVPLLLVSGMAWHLSAGASALARLAFIGALLVFSAVSARMLRPATGLFAAEIAKRPRGWLSTLRGIWYPSLVAVPLVLAIGAAVGYVFTTKIIFTNMVETYWVIVAIAIGLGMMDRFFQSTSERFAWRRGTTPAEQRRLDEQVRRVVRLATFLVFLAGLAAAWSDVFPALGLMRSVELWTVSGGDGVPLKVVTVRDVIVCALVIVLTVQLVRDLPGVLGLALLQRFPLDDSARYAIVSLGRYLLVLGGLIAGFAALKIGWSNVQWLAAAVTVGLGFGLQEIFANFVSGLIMLTERPVRIGDVVTVDSVTGRVIKIATRATTLVDGDEKEVIIPNKQFITTRIVNWTLDDGPVRFGLAVGVEHGSDLKLATKLFAQALSELPKAVKDPAPVAALREFGESAVVFDLWYFVAHPRDSLETRHALMIRIDELFQQHGLTLANPLLDIRVRELPKGAPA